jgi:hypothetical protein
MRRFLTFLVLSVALMPLTGEARSIAELFAMEPGNIFPLLTRTARLDMVDYYNSGQMVAVPNNLAGESRLLELDSAYLKVQTSDSRVVEMLVRKAGKDTVITVIETVMTPVPDSRLTQWNAHWQQFTSDKLFKKPAIDDFMVKKMPQELRAELQAVMAFPLVQLAFTGENHSAIEATHGLDRFLTREEYKRFAGYFKPSISFGFNGLKIKPVKK